MIALALEEALISAFREDIGMGDLTTFSIFDEMASAKGVFTAKNRGL